MSDEQQSQISFALPVQGFRKTLVFNRFWLEKVSGVGLLAIFDFHHPRVFRSNTNTAFIISNLAVQQSMDRLAKYLHSIGLPETMTKPLVELSVSEGNAEPVDYINCSRIDDMGEITLFSFNFHAAVKRPTGEVGKLDIIADPVIKLRSNLETHRFWIQEFLKINANS